VYNINYTDLCLTPTARTDASYISQLEALLANMSIRSTLYEPPHKEIGRGEVRCIWGETICLL